MPKFKVKHKYAVWIFEEHVVEINREDYETDEAYQEDIDLLSEDSIEFTYDGTLKHKAEGDYVGDTWESEVEEINVLDQIVEAVGPE